MTLYHAQSINKKNSKRNILILYNINKKMDRYWMVKSQLSDTNQFNQKARSP